MRVAQRLPKTSVIALLNKVQKKAWGARGRLGNGHWRAEKGTFGCQIRFVGARVDWAEKSTARQMIPWSALLRRLIARKKFCALAEARQSRRGLLLSSEAFAPVAPRLSRELASRAARWPAAASLHKTPCSRRASSSPPSMASRSIERESRARSRAPKANFACGGMDRPPA